MKFIAILVSFFLVSCSFAGEKVTDHATLYYNDLSLISKNGKCVLQSTASSKTTELIFNLVPPCYFIRDKKDNKLQYYSYPRLDADFVVIVFGNPLSKDKRKMWGLKNDEVCGSAAQGVIIKNNAVRLSKKILRDGLSCIYGGHDEKDYWYFAKYS